jgi:glycosyltransferase A (GT-A) superfamily protein (DUF2064 family)
MIGLQLILLAKQPVPGQVKTRLCPPFTAVQAAAIAAAAIADTVNSLSATPADHRTLVHTGTMAAPSGWEAVPQRGVGLGERLHHAFVDTARPGLASLLVGMDTPQLTPVELTRMIGSLEHADAVVGPAKDGGWWGLLLRDPELSSVLPSIPMSMDRTGLWTAAALRRLGARVWLGDVLQDVDTAADAAEVALLSPAGHFGRAIAAAHRGTVVSR